RATVAVAARSAPSRLHLQLLGRGQTTVSRTALAFQRGGTGIRRSLPAILFAAAAMLVLARPGSAATISVATTAKLQAALHDAHSGDTIQLAAGVYAPDAPLHLTSGVTLAGPNVAGPQGTSPGAVILGSNLEGAASSDVVTVDSGVSATIKNVS